MDWTSYWIRRTEEDTLDARALVERAVRKNKKTLDPGAANFSWSADGSKLIYQTDYTGEYNRRAEIRISGPSIWMGSPDSADGNGLDLKPPRAILRTERR